MKSKATEYNRTYTVGCPHCLERHQHNAQLSFKVYKDCKESVEIKRDNVECDVCLRLFNIKFDKATHEVEINYSEAKNSLVLLRSINNEGKDPIFVLVKSVQPSKLKDWDHADDLYYFNEHTCPTNYIDVEMIVYQSDPDPHGVFEFVRRIYLDEYDTMVRAYNNAVGGEIIRSTHVMTSHCSNSNSLEWQVLLIPEAYPDHVDEVFGILFPHIPEYARKLMGKKRISKEA